MSQASTSQRILREHMVAGSYPTYRRAEQAAAFLADQGLPIDRVGIVGLELRLVTAMADRRPHPYGAARTGAIWGAWLGLLAAVLASLLLTTHRTYPFLLLGGVVLGATLGALDGLIACPLRGPPPACVA